MNDTRLLDQVLFDLDVANGHKQNDERTKVITFGEILLRLAAPGYTKLFQKDNLESTFCGGEANVAVSLAMFGLDSSYVTKVPDSDVGYAAVNSLRYFGVDIEHVVFGNGRMGLYYLEKGASQRPSKVIYDRAYSAISLAKKSEFDWDSIFSGADWFHWTGINPALSDEMAEIWRLSHPSWNVDSIAIFSISSIPIFRIEKDMVFPPFGKRYFQNVTEFSGLLVTW